MDDARVSRSGESTFVLFGYGSLSFAPELPEAVLRVLPARLHGFARQFNKRSRSRGCLRSDSFDAFPGHHPDFVVGASNHSLVLGTEAVPDAVLDGFAIEYPRSARAEVLARTDRREDFAAGRPVAENGYLRQRVTVALRDNAEVVAETYLTNDAPGAAWAAPGDFTDADRARILVNATPREVPAAEREARGVYYLEGVRRELLAVGVVDARLEALAGAVRALDGPWVERVAPPRR